MLSDSNKSILHLRAGLSWKEKQIAVEMARLFGFQSESAEFPVVSGECGEEIPGEMEGLNRFLTKNHAFVVPKGYVSATDSAKPVEDFDWRVKKGLEALFTSGEILKDDDFDFLPDRMDVQFVMEKDADLSILAAACTFAFRMGMETTAYEGLLLTDKEGEGSAVVFEEAQDCSVRLEKKEKGIRIVVSGNGERLEAFVSDFCEHFPLQGEFDTWTDYLQEMTDSMCMMNLDGQLAYAKAYAAPGGSVFASPEIEDKMKNNKKVLQDEFPDISFTNYKSTVKVYEKEYDIPWEADVLREIIRGNVCPKLKKGDVVQIYAAVSEDKKARSIIESELKGLVKATGADLKKVSVLCAYKQGYSWLEEEVVPSLLKMEQTDRIEIGFKPFLPPGVTDWKDEDGATPSYHNVGNDPDKWYDLPIRYLQELYPVEDMLVKRLGILREKLHFHVYEGNEDLTYEVKVYGKGNKAFYENNYKAECRERPYLDAYPQMGKVHPSTGYLKVVVNGELFLNQRIETDVERIWSVYQEQVLPDCRKYIEEKTNGNITPAGQPFFSKLEIVAEASEPDYRLGCREDLFSTLDGMHEDMYFAGADYFKNYGLEKAGAMLDAPGLILPVIRKKSGKPYMKVTLYSQKEQKPSIQNGKEILYAKSSRKNVQCYIKAIREAGLVKTDAAASDPTKVRCRLKKAIVQIEGADRRVVRAYAELLSKNLLSMGQKLRDVGLLELKTERDSYTVTVNPPEEIKKDLSIRDIDLPEEELIGYEKYLEIIEKLKRVPQLSVYKTAVSYTGRDIYAVEILPSHSGYLSRTKRITQHPSEIINSRHHANEVSGTNSAFMLIKALLTDEKYRDIPNKLNLVIVPMENVDGTAIHYELQKENPYWKLHVARFNAIGKEFYYEHFKPDTIHTEAMGLTRLFRTFLPDIIVDNHGVPSHEWEQQFSGYTSPSYKGFWLPRSLLYGYFWTVADEAYKSNYDVNKKMEDVIADAIAEDGEITCRNKEWASQFEKFAHGWMPKLFPANYYKDMINYWIPFAYDSMHRYPSIRFPWITTVAYTSEVADETAQGKYLKLCARAHLTHDLATLEMMSGSICVYKNKWNISDDNITAAHIRQRPVIV